MDKIENLRKKYYESISLLQNKEDIENALPKPEYESFFPLISGLISMLEKELASTQEILQDNSEMREYIEEEISLIKLKLDICNNLLHKATEDKQIEEEALVTPKKNIIFATTDSGNVCIENDMKTVPEEFYTSVKRLLIRLQEGVVEDNGQKAKCFTTVDKKNAGIHEIKEFKVRLFYKNLSPDTVYVLMVRMKKSDNDRLDRGELINRASLINKQYESLKKEIKDLVIKEELIKQNKEYLDRILGHIEQKKR